MSTEQMITEFLELYVRPRDGNVAAARPALEIIISIAALRAKRETLLKIGGR